MRNCPEIECRICHEHGHMQRQCPQNRSRLDNTRVYKLIKYRELIDVIIVESQVILQEIVVLLYIIILIVIYI